jgi:hypothetical protein
MAYSYNNYIGDGTTNLFSAPKYLDKAHIQAYISGVFTSFSWTNSSTISFASPPLAGAKVLVKRVTPITDKLVDFQNASLLDEVSLDNNTDFLLYAVQESVDAASSALIKDVNGNYDAANKRIVNLANPVNTADAVNMVWSETQLNTALTSHVGTMHNGSTVMVLDDEYDAATYMFLAERFEHL